jgi:hypothetical protein
MVRIGAGFVFALAIYEMTTAFLTVRVKCLKLGNESWDVLTRDFNVAPPNVTTRCHWLKHNHRMVVSREIRIDLKASRRKHSVAA